MTFKAPHYAGPDGERIPARFGRVFEFDPKAMPATPAHAEAIRRALVYPIGGVHDAINSRLAKAYKKTGRAAIIVSSPPAGTIPFAHAGSYFIALSKTLSPADAYTYARHELGHVVEINLFSFVDRGLIQGLWPGAEWAVVREQFAEAFRAWLDSNGDTFPILTPILIPPP